MLKPRALRPGDRLALVAPASPFDLGEFERGVDEVRRLGFEPAYDDRVFERRNYVSGEAATRAAVLREAWRDPAIAGIVAVRGGYGSVQLLPFLDRSEPRLAAKVFVGYSDLTSLLIYLTTLCGLVCFHGPMIAGRLARGDEGYDRDSFLRATMRAEPLGELAPPGLETIRSGEASGVLLGGTLTQILASLGTPFAFVPPDGYLLFVDEVGERPYRLDRMLTQLRLAGLLGRAAGIVVGELPACDEATGSPTARGVVADLLAGFPGPVIYGFPSGHTRGPAMTLPFGVRARIVADTTPRLIVEEAAVA
jgi:muramoyltetrapeptide carboxypeptidase